jgi:hypothetical protein
VIHEHGVGHAAAQKGSLQPLPHGLGARRPGALERDRVAAGVVEHRQRADRLVPSLGALEVHLPELVGLLALESAHRSLVAILHPHQPVPQQHAMHRHRRHMQTFTPEQHRQFARSPVGPFATQRHDPLLDRLGRARRTRTRSAAPFADSSHAFRTIPPQPQIPGWSRDVELRAQPRHAPAALAGGHNEPHPLLLDLHRPPRHPALLRFRGEASPLAPSWKAKSVKDVPKQSVKDVMSLYS